MLYEAKNYKSGHVVASVTFTASNHEVAVTEATARLGNIKSSFTKEGQSVAVVGVKCIGR